MKKFSIVIPVYNVEKYIDRCLEHILNQTYSNYEIILVDDGSKDNSPKIIDDYANKYPEIIKVYHQENQGPAKARSFGVSKVTGDYLMFIDSDDYIKEDVLEVLNKSITNDEDVIGFGYTEFDENDNIVSIGEKELFDTISGEEALEKLIMARNQIEMIWSYIYNINFWKENNIDFLDVKYREDFCLILEVLAKAKTVKTIKYNGYYYAYNPNSIIRSNIDKSLKRAEDIITIFDYQMKNIVPNVKRVSSKRVLESYLANAVINSKNSLNGDMKENYIKKLRERKVADLLLDNTLKRKLKKYKIMLEIKLNK